MGAPPSVFAKARAEFAELTKAYGLVEVRAEYHEATFGGAFAEYRGGAGALRLVWDGKDATLFAELLEDGRWIDVETLVAGRPPPVDHDQSDARISRLVRAATAAWSRRG